MKYFLKMGKNVVKIDYEFGFLAERSKNLDEEMKDIEVQKSMHEADIISHIAPMMQDTGAGTAHILSGKEKICTIKTGAETVKIEDPEGLKKILGSRFPDLVRQKEVYEAEKRLREIVLGKVADDLADDVVELVTVKDRKASVSYV